MDAAASGSASNRAKRGLIDWPSSASILSFAISESKGGADGADDELFVVGVGASAGGVRALSQFFAAVPRESGMAYVVILHLSPDYDSQLAEVL